MCQEELLPVAEVGLDKDALVVAVLVEEARDELLRAHLVSLYMIIGHLQGHLVPDIHEFFKLVSPSILKVEFGNFLAHDLLNEMLLTHSVNLAVQAEFVFTSQDASHWIKEVRQRVLGEHILVLH